jgi:hypothetical protein
VCNALSTNEKLGMQQILKAGPTLQIWAVDGVSEAKVTHPILVLAMELLVQFPNGLCIHFLVLQELQHIRD